MSVVVNKISNAVTSAINGNSVGVPSLRNLFPVAFRADLVQSLNARTGIGTYNFTSDADGDSTFIPYDNGIVDCKAHEARFDGMRRVENLLPSTVAADIFNPSFAADGGAALAPDGTLTAKRLTPNGTFLIAFYSNIHAVGSDPVNSIWLRGVCPSLTLYTGDGNTTIPVTITTEWKRYSASALNSAALGFLGFGTPVANPTDWVEYWHPQAENAKGKVNKNPSEFISVGEGTGPEIGADAMLASATWTAGGIASTGDSIVITAASGAPIWNQGITLPANRQYQVSFDYTGVSGVVVPIIGSAAAALVPAGSGRYSQTVRTSASGGNTLAFSLVGANGTLTNLSIKEINHGSNVNGVKYLPYTNPNQVNVGTKVVTADVATTPLTGNGILIEPERTNLHLYSENLSNAAWTEWNVQTINASLNPIAGLPAWNLKANSTAPLERGVYNNAALTITSTVDQVLSFFIAAGTKNIGYIYGAIGVHTLYCYYDLTGDGAVLSNVASGSNLVFKDATIKPVVGGYLCTLTTTSTAVGTSWYTTAGLCDADGSSISTPTATGEILGTVTGIQFEDNKSFPTSYIPTTTAPVTRTGDKLIYPHENLPKDSNGIVNDIVIVIPFYLPYDGSLHAASSYLFETCAISVGTERITCFIQSSGVMSFGTTTGSSYLQCVSNNPLLAGEHKASLRLSSTTGMSLFIDGVKQTSTQAGRTQGINYSVTPFDMYINSSVNGNNQSMALIDNVRIYGKDLSDTKCEELSAL